MAKESVKGHTSVAGSRRGKTIRKHDANNLASQILGATGAVNTTTSMIKVAQSNIGNGGAVAKPPIVVYDDGVDVTPLPLVSPNVTHGRSAGGGSSKTHEGTEKVILQSHFTS